METEGRWVAGEEEGMGNDCLMERGFLRDKKNRELNTGDGCTTLLIPNATDLYTFKMVKVRGYLAGSADKVCDSWSQGREYEPHVGWRNYFKKKKW